MVRTCFLCKAVCEPRINVSLHCLPAVPERRNAWIQNLNLSECDLPKRCNICSQHFNEDYFSLRPGGTRYLKPNAIPSIFKKDTNRSTERSDALQVVFSSPSSSKLITAQEKYSSGWESSFMIADKSKWKLNESGSSSTITCSETARQISEEFPMLCNELSTSNSLVIQNSKKRKRYLGELSTSDFSTPTERKKHMAVLRKHRTIFRKRYQYMHNRLKRSENRIKSLKGLLKELRDRHMLSGASEPMLKAAHSGPRLALFERMLQGRSTAKYNESLRKLLLNGRQWGLAP